MCAVVLIEGFDHLTGAALTAKGWSGGSPASMQAGRFDGQCMRQSTTSQTKALGGPYSTLFVGVAIRPSISPPAVQRVLFRLYAGAVRVADVALNTSGYLCVLNAAGGTVATGTTPINPNAWVYVEVKIVVNGASGTCELHLNGNSASPEIAQTTGNFGANNIDTLILSGPGTSAGSVDHDDVYVLDTSGSAPRNTWLGDVRVETIYPSGDGAHTDWTPDTAGAHYSRVNEAQADGDTSYVSDATPGHIDTYTMGDIDGGASVFGVQTCMYARKDDANLRQIAPVIRKSSTDYVGTTATLSGSYAVATQIYQQDPTAADWTPTTVNGMEVGVKEIA